MAFRQTCFCFKGNKKNINKLTKISKMPPEKGCTVLCVFLCKSKIYNIIQKKALNFRAL